MADETQPSHTETVDFNRAVDGILNTDLNAENIRTGVPDAINQLIALAGDAVGRWQQETGIQAADEQAAEDSAFTYFGLASIGDILHHLGALEARIRSLDDVIDKRTQVSEVLVPPDTQPVKAEPGSMTFEQTKIFDRVRTILFILAQDFDVDVHDPEQVTLTEGVVTENMVRRTSYLAIDVPAIDRVILVCDEENNASFVFRRETLDALCITSGMLALYSKPELNALIDAQPGIGRRMNYSVHFVQRMIAALGQPIEARLDDAQFADTSTTYLRPERENMLSRRGMTDLWHIDHRVLEKAINATRDSLGSTGHRRTIETFSEQQQAIIHDYLEKVDALAPTLAGYASRSAMAQNYHVDYDKINAAIAYLGETLGDPRKVKFVKKTEPGYSPDQQRMIKEHLIATGILLPEATEGMVTIPGAAELLGISERAVNKYIAILRLELVRRLFKVTPARAIDPDQLEKLRVMRDANYHPSQQRDNQGDEDTPE